MGTVHHLAHVGEVLPQGLKDRNQPGGSDK